MEYRFADRMTDLEAMMWGLERLDPTYRSTMSLVVSFDREPDRAKVRDRMERVSGRVPRLRDRVVAGPLTMVPPRWEPDPDFQVANHVRDITYPGPETPGDLFVVAGALASEPFDPARPPWRLSFVASENLATGVPVGVYLTSGSLPRFPIRMTLFTLFAMAATPKGRKL